MPPRPPQATRGRRPSGGPLRTRPWRGWQVPSSGRRPSRPAGWPAGGGPAAMPAIPGAARSPRGEMLRIRRRSGSPGGEADPLDDAGRGPVPFVREDLDAAPQLLHDGGLRQRVPRVVAALDEDMGPDIPDQLARLQLFERHDV